MNLAKIEGSPSLEVVNLVLEKKSRGEKVISLAIGDPSFETPKEIVEIAHQSMISGDVHYISSYGTLDVREAIKNKVRRKNAIKAQLENCLFVTTRFSIYAALVAVSEASFDALIPDPGYFYSEPIILAGGNPISYKLAPDFSLDIGAIKRKISDKTKAILINSPSNPTSKVLDKSELEELYELCREKSIYIISDEAYEDLVYDDKEHFSIGSLEDCPEIVISVFSLSKSYCMTGWRAGYVVAGKSMIYLMNKFLENTVTCFPPFIQKASAYALNNGEEYIANFKKKFGERRDAFVEMLDSIKALECNEIEGAFYAFPRYEGRFGNSIELAKRILLEQGVAILPGVAFGQSGEHHFRLSFSGTEEDSREGMKRMRTFFESRV
jgi:aspartate/methionine/tyrosine aminotransferase